MDDKLTIAVIAALAALLGSLIPTIVGYINNRDQRKFETHKALREKQRDAYSGLLLTLEETISVASRMIA